MTRLPPFPKSAPWLNSPVLGQADLAGRVVAINFWTYTCINWLRTLPYLRAWWEKYRDQGLIFIGVHTPEFSFEHNLANVRQAAADMGVTWPVAIDNDYAIWQAFANHYWPALYVADEAGHIRHFWYGEGGYEESERAIQGLLAAAGARPVGGLVPVEASGLEVAADITNVQSYENYLGYQKTSGFASPGEAAPDHVRHYQSPARLDRNQWALQGKWTITEEASVLAEAGGRLADRFHARDLNLVMGPTTGSRPVPFRVLLDGHQPGPSHGSDIAPDGHGIAVQQRTYQLIRQAGQISDSQLEIEFLKSGVEVLAFTFG
jgi:thiol-disulfide isomerase/thioredoxin